MNKLILVPLLFSASFALQAESRSFDIELLIFKRNPDIVNTKERWPNQVTTPDYLSSDAFLSKNADNCQQATTDCAEKPPTQPVRPSAIASSINGRSVLSPGQLKMNYLTKKLSRHSEYTPLLHMGWREYVNSPQKASYVHLFGGKNYSYQFDKDGNEIIEEEPQLIPLQKSVNVSSKNNDIDKEKSQSTTIKLKSDLWELDGQLQISLNHYLYVDFDMLLREISERDVMLKPQAPKEIKSNNTPLNSKEPSIVIGDNETSNSFAFATETKETEPFLQSYSFKQKRRLKSEEVYYFDHPQMGMILQIRKLEEKKETVDQ